MVLKQTETRISPFRRITNVLGKLSLLGGCIFCISSCSQSDHLTSSQAALIDKINRNHDFADDLRTPGMNSAKYLGSIELSAVVANAIKNHRSALVLRNEAEAFAKEADPLRDFSKREADCITKLSFIRFPFTDKMIEPLQGKPLIDLQILQSDLRDLHALKGMSSLEVVDLSENPLHVEALQVLGTLPNLRKLAINSTPITDSDLRSLYKLDHLRRLKISECKGLSERGVQKLAKALPNCRISHSWAKRSPGRKLLDIAKVSRDDGDIKSATATVSKLIADLSKAHSDDYALLSDCHKFLGDSLLAQHDEDKALAEYAKADSLGKQVNDAESEK